MSILLMFGFAVLRLRRAPGIATLLVFAWFLILSFAFFATANFSDFSSESTFFLFRQVAMPAFVIIAGMTLSRREWTMIINFTIAIALLNVAYMSVELTVGRIIDPALLAKNGGYYVGTDGLPGYYHGRFLFGGGDFTRLGGLLLNPPTTGLFLATAAIMAFYQKARFRWPVTLLLLAALLMTGSRGGMLLAAIGLVLPILARRLGAWVSALLLVLMAIPFGIEVASIAGSARHSSGLIQGLDDAFNYWFGRGFGYVGNHRDDVTEGAGESLLGIAFSTAGLAAVLLVAMLMVYYVTAIGRWSSMWEAALGLGAVAAALFAETASSMNGTLPMWLAAGVALTLGFRGAHPPPDEPGSERAPDLKKDEAPVRET